MIATERGFEFKQGPRDWPCQTAGAAAPAGGRKPPAVGDRGGLC